MKTALRKVLRVLKKGEDYFVYIPPNEDLGKESFQLFFNSFNLQRKEANIITKLLINEKQKEIIEKHYTTLIKKEVKFTDFSFPSRLGIFKNHVLIITDTKQVLTILIESEETYKMYKEFFIGLWESS